MDLEQAQGAPPQLPLGAAVGCAGQPPSVSPTNCGGLFLPPPKGVPRDMPSIPAALPPGVLPTRCCLGAGCCDAHEAKGTGIACFRVSGGHHSRRMLQLQTEDPGSGVRRPCATALRLIGRRFERSLAAWTAPGGSEGELLLYVWVGGGECSPTWRV